MAKVSVVFDTKEKTLQVSLNGETLKNIDSVAFYAYSDNEASAEINQRMYNEEEKMVEMKRTIAKAGVDGCEICTSSVPTIEQLACVFGYKSKNSV